MSRVAVITGAAGGIGTALALRMVDEGVRVALVDSNSQGLEATANRVNCEKQLVFAGDGTNENEISRIVTRILEVTGRIDILFNNLGGPGKENVLDIEDISPELWDQIIGLNLRSAYLWSRAVMPHMRQRSYGRIVNVSSTMAHGRHGPVPPGGARLAYVAAKAAIIGFTSQLAKDVGRDNITVNSVLPWITLSEQGTRVREMFENLPVSSKESILSRSPLGRAGEVHEVARAMAFLASDEASYVSGVALPVDGAFL